MSTDHLHGSATSSCSNRALTHRLAPGARPDAPCDDHTYKSFDITHSHQINLASVSSQDGDTPPLLASSSPESN